VVFSIRCDHHRREGTSAQASNGLDLYLFPAEKLLQDLGCSAHMASGAQTYTHEVLTARLENKLGIEGGHTVDPAQRNPQPFGYFFQAFGREIAPLLLNSLKNRDKKMWISWELG